MGTVQESVSGTVLTAWHTGISPSVNSLEWGDYRAMASPQQVSEQAQNVVGPSPERLHLNCCCLVLLPQATVIALRKRG